ncbi:uncharacterized protein LOC143568921 [Bidens hawaiensis]|uniref:uncharacterized protein LOC143568921 n=1 Tax=Bidens hawaiensis TaxID=980011 RepID=UPI00404A99F8
MVSNNDLLSMYRRLQEQVERQNKTNQMLVRELEDIRKAKKPVEEFTPLVPRSLDFTPPRSSRLVRPESTMAYNSGSSSFQHSGSAGLHSSGSQGYLYASSAGPFQRSGSSVLFHQTGSSGPYQQAVSSGFQQQPGSSGVPTTGFPNSQQPFAQAQQFTGSSKVHQGDFIPMQANYSTVPFATPGNTMFGNASYNTQTVPQNINQGNTFNTIPFNANQGFLQDAGISKSLARELQKLKDMISNVPGVIRPIAEVPIDSHRISRFVPSIGDVQIPKRFQTPNMKLYDGSTDPEEHVSQYRERMEINPIPMEIKEACLYKGFGSTLTGATMKWLLFENFALLSDLLGVEERVEKFLSLDPTIRTFQAKFYEAFQESKSESNMSSAQNSGKSTSKFSLEDIDYMFTKKETPKPTPVSEPRPITTQAKSGAKR